MFEFLVLLSALVAVWGGYGLFVVLTNRAEGVPPIHEQILHQHLQAEADQQMLRAGYLDDAYDVFGGDDDRA